MLDQDFDWQWVVKTCLCALFMCVLAFQEDTKNLLSFGGMHSLGPATAAFVSVMVQDVTVGATIINVIGCVVYSLFATILCICGICCLYKTESEYPALAFVFVFSFLLSYLDFSSPMGKKLGISVVALNLVSYDYQQSKTLGSAISGCAYWYADILLGCSISCISTLLPWPRFAGSQLEKRSIFCASSISCIFEEIIISWQHLKFVDTDESKNVPINCNLDDKKLSVNNIKKFGVVKQPRKRSLWILLRTVLRVIIVFRSLSKTDAGKKKMKWIHDRKEKRTNYGKLSERKALLSLVEVVLNDMASLQKEAKFGPKRTKALDRYSHFIPLLRDFQIITGIMESRLCSMNEVFNKNDQAKFIFSKFHAVPQFREYLRKFSTKITSCLRIISIRLSQDDILSDNVLEKELEELNHLRTIFDEEYLLMRMKIYYRKDGNINLEQLTLLQENKNGENGKLGDFTGSEVALLCPDALLLMNSFLFFHDFACDSIVQFCKGHQNISKEQAANRTYLSWITSFFNDIFPSQRLLFAISYDKEKNIYIIPKALHARLLSSIILATSMTFAGAYGLAASRPQPFMASFTVAYLSGGSATGFNLVTSINRAVGTILACVYTLIVLLCFQNEENWSNFSANVFIAIAVIVFQVPCVHIRSQPVISYTGTVAGFSSIFLLLASRYPSLATDRIIDTFVGIAIFVALEIGFSSEHSENILLEDFDNTTSLIVDRFTHFLKLLVHEGDGIDDDDNKYCDDSDSDENKDIHMTQPNFESKRQLLLYNDAEYFFGPGLPTKLLEKVVHYQETCHHAITSLSMIVSVSTNYEGEMKYLLKPLGKNFEDIQKIVDLCGAQIRENLDCLREGGEGLQLKKKKGRMDKLAGNCDLIYSAEPDVCQINVVELDQQKEKEYNDDDESVDLLEMELQKLETSFMKAVAKLQGRNLSKPDLHLLDSAPAPGAKMTNIEVKTVNAYVSSIKDLLHGLKGLMLAVQDLKSYRLVRKSKKYI